MAWLTITPDGLSDLGQTSAQQQAARAAVAADPVTGVLNLIETIVGAGARFIPETREMRERREAQEALERERLEAQRIRGALTGRTARTVALVVGGLGLLWVLTRGRRKR